MEWDTRSLSQMPTAVPRDVAMWASPRVARLISSDSIETITAKLDATVQRFGFLRTETAGGGRKSIVYAEMPCGWERA